MNDIRNTRLVSTTMAGRDATHSKVSLNNNTASSHMILSNSQCCIAKFIAEL